MRAADLILTRARDARTGRLLRLIPLDGADADAIPAGVLEDHAHLLEALVVLYEATFAPRWLDAATELAGVLIRDFGDETRGGFFSTADDHEQLVARRKDLDDARFRPVRPVPRSACCACTRSPAAASCGRRRRASLRIGARFAAEHPGGFGEMLSALDQYVETPREIAIVGEGPDAEALLAVAREVAGGGRTVIAAAPTPTEAVPLLAGRTLVDGRPAAYVCERMACRIPVTVAG